MMKYQLIYPMAVYVFFMFGLAMYMFFSRVKALKTREVSFSYFKTYTGTAPQEKTLVIGRHYDNQFQVPVLFLLTGGLFIALEQASYLTVLLAWLFVISRWGHSWVHLGKNNVQHRAMAFGAGWLILLIMWIQLLYQVSVPSI